MPTARTTDGMSWSYAPPPAKQTRRSAEPSLARPSFPISPSTSASASPSGRSRPPARRNAAGIDSNSSSRDDRPTKESISAISASVCGTNDGISARLAADEGKGDHTGGQPAAPDLDLDLDAL